MVYEMSESDVLFGDGNKEPIEDEATLIFAEAFSKLSLKEKLRTQDQFRTASGADKLRMLDRFLGPLPALTRGVLPTHLGGTNRH